MNRTVDVAIRAQAMTSLALMKMSPVLLLEGRVLFSVLVDGGDCVVSVPSPIPVIVTSWLVKDVAAVVTEVVFVCIAAVVTGPGLIENQTDDHDRITSYRLTVASEELHLTHCKLETAAELTHQHFLCVEIDIDADIPATCWLSTWWHCSNFYISVLCSCCIPDVKTIWYSIEF